MPLRVTQVRQAASDACRGVRHGLGGIFFGWVDGGGVSSVFSLCVLGFLWGDVCVG